MENKDKINEIGRKALATAKACLLWCASNWKVTVIAVALIVAAVTINKVIEAFQEEKETIHEIVLVDTPIQIEDVRPRGEIYVCSAIIEDYTSVQKEETHLGIIKEKHSCVQMLRQKCSYKIDLDKVEYTPDTLNRVIVKMPKVEYVATTQNSPFMSDDEDYWYKVMPNTNKLKQKVAKQIKQRFDTKSNRDKADLYAKEVVSGMLEDLGYEAVFVTDIEEKRE